MRESCERCGYTLQGIAFDRPCPECGLSNRAAGATPQLCNAPPTWFSKLQWGQWLSYIAFVIAGTCAIMFLTAAVVGALGELRVRTIVFPVVTSAAIGATAMLLMGAILATSKHPLRKYRWRSRSVPRLCAFGVLSLAALLGPSRALAIKLFRGAPEVEMLMNLEALAIGILMAVTTVSLLHYFALVMSDYDLKGIGDRLSNSATNIGSAGLAILITFGGAFLAEQYLLPTLADVARCLAFVAFGAGLLSILGCVWTMRTMRRVLAETSRQAGALRDSHIRCESG